MAVYMLTTVDNPYNPFEDFNKWYMWDESHGYDSCGRIARLAKSTAGMSQEQIESVIEDAIDKVVLNDFTTLFRKVNETEAKELVKQRLSDDFDKNYLPN